MSSPDKNIRVGIAGNALVVSLPTAEAPRVWRADMGQLQNAALEVQNNQGKHTLVMKRSDAPAEEIATFADKEDAVKALQMITDVLLTGKEGTPPPKKAGWFKRTLKLLWSAISTICVVLILLNIFIFMNKRPLTEGASTQAPAAQTGMPTPADEILGK